MTSQRDSFVAMAEKLGILNQLLFGDWSERATINHNAEELTNVAATVIELQQVVQRQSDEIDRLRAMFMGVVDVLQDKAGIDPKHLEEAVQAAWSILRPPPPPPMVLGPALGDPYRGTPSDASTADVDAAKSLLRSAQDHHFSKRFAEARKVYEEVIERYGHTTQALTAREQVKNLRDA